MKFDSRDYGFDGPEQLIEEADIFETLLIKGSFLNIKIKSLSGFMVGESGVFINICQSVLISLEGRGSYY